MTLGVDEGSFLLEHHVGVAGAEFLAMLDEQAAI
jgi:hypothetical protein